MAERYDVAVIGSGPGGYVAAIRAAQLGLKTVCIEKMNLGGTCLNVGCIPSKALLHSSELLYRLQNEGAQNGIQMTGKVDFSAMQERKSNIVKGFVSGIGGLFRKNKIDHIQGTATLSGPHTITVNGQTIDASHIILATGSQPVGLPFLPFDEKKVLSSTGALDLTQIPKKLLVVGAGIIGVELGSVYARLGSEVVFIEFLDRVCPSLDKTLSQLLEKVLTKQKMTFHLSHKVVKASVEEKQVYLQAEGKNGLADFTADAVLVAIGRKPYSEGLGLEKLGIQKDPRGFVLIDSCFRTSIPHIFAIGDLVDGPMLAHKASEEGVAVAEFIAGHSARIQYMAIPNVAYTHPEVAGVGLTEEAAKEMGLSIKSASFPFKANSRARCTGEEEGLVKIIIETETKRILGIHILGAHASELIAEGVLAIQLKATVDQLADTCHAHPTLSEAIKEAALALTKGALHI
jgi:dihydrolipoamide dehydrogenase